MLLVRAILVLHIFVGSAVSSRGGSCSAKLLDTEQMEEGSAHTRYYMETKKMRIDLITMLKTLATQAYAQVGQDELWVINMDMDTHVEPEEPWITTHRTATVPPDLECKPGPCKRVEKHTARRSISLKGQHEVLSGAPFGAEVLNPANALVYGASLKMSVHSSPNHLQVVKGWHIPDQERYSQQGTIVVRGGGVHTPVAPGPTPEYGCADSGQKVTGGIHVYVGQSAGGECLFYDIKTMANRSDSEDILKRLICTRHDGDERDTDPTPEDCLNYLTCAMSNLYWRSSPSWWRRAHGAIWLTAPWQKGEADAECLRDGDREGLWHYGESCANMCGESPGPCPQWCGKRGACCKWNVGLGNRTGGLFGEAYSPSCGRYGSGCVRSRCCVPDQAQDGWLSVDTSEGFNDEGASPQPPAGVMPTTQNASLDDPPAADSEENAARRSADVSQGLAAEDMARTPMAVEAPFTLGMREMDMLFAGSGLT